MPSIESELARERRRKDEFLAILAHELRNPLAPLRHMLEIQKHNDGDEAMNRQARAVMERQLLHFIRLGDDLLDVNRISLGKLELRRERLTIQSIILQAVEVCRPLLDQHRHSLIVELPEDALTLDGDPTRLVQVFGNLLTNACKYTPSEGMIELNAKVIDGAVKVTVKDNSSGIPPDQFERIFEMFSQADRTVKRAQGGLGIGLMLVKQLVEMHGGGVTAFSPGLGQGSTFTATLPLSADEPVFSNPSVNSTPSPLRIMVVDDNKDVADSLASLLSVQGHQIRAVYSGVEALRTAAQWRPEVVLLDIGMPGSGYDVCQQLRKQEWGMGLSVIALTGWGQENYRKDSEDAGFDAHLVKPIDARVLNDLLQKLPRRGS